MSEGDKPAGSLECVSALFCYLLKVISAHDDAPVGAAGVVRHPGL
jgi:hypothetical protein